MKIICMSDSHGRNKMIDLLLKKHQDADLFVHCGDIECDEFVYPTLETVAGNNDIYYDYPQLRRLKVGKHRILIMHSHQCMYFTRRSEWLAKEAAEHQCDIVLYGHTHIAKDEVVNGIRLINPGSLRYARDGRKPSYAIIDLNEEVHVEFVFEPFE